MLRGPPAPAPDAQKRRRDPSRAQMGVPVSWFRSKINARYHVNWRHYGAPSYELPQVDALLANAYDLKMPPYFDDADFPHLAEVIAYSALVAVGRA